MSELIDNRAQRVRTLKGIIKRLHAGEAPVEVRAILKELVCRTDYSEVMATEQKLIADGMPVEEIQGMCDLHSEVTREVLVQLAPPPVLPGHPVDTFRRENEALRQSIARLQLAMNRVLETADDGDVAAPNRCHRVRNEPAGRSRNHGWGNAGGLSRTRSHTLGDGTRVRKATQSSGSPDSCQGLEEGSRPQCGRISTSDY